MNVIHVSTKDGGGAGNVAQSLSERLNRRDGVDSRLLVETKTSDSDTVSEFTSLPYERTLNTGVERLASLEGLAAPSSFQLRHRLKSMDADVLHLHNLHGQYFNLLALLTVPSDVGIVWTFHDMWPFTGNCVYSYDCRRFEESCGSCPQTDTYPSLSFDTTPLLIRLKEFVTRRASITAVAPSQWMLKLARQSRVEFAETRHVPNGVDIDRFSTVDREQSRDYFDIPDGETVLLFVAEQLDLRRKGMAELLSALESLPEKESVTLLTIGGGDADIPIEDAFTVRSPGYVPDDVLPQVYAAADLFVIPSLAENCPLTVLEAMACGTPVVAFPTGGIVEQVDHGETGWICAEKTPTALAEELSQHLYDRPALREAGKKAARRANEEFSLAETTSRYLSLYQRLV